MDPKFPTLTELLPEGYDHQNHQNTNLGRPIKTLERFGWFLSANEKDEQRIFAAKWNIKKHGISELSSLAAVLLI